MKKIELRNEIKNDKYTDYIYQSFDIQNKEETVTEINYDLSELDNIDWNVGVVVGASGSGKTSILEDFGDIWDIKFNKDKPLISNFDFLEPEEATRLLTSMGLSSVPTWLRPFKTLSNGEQYRATLAYLVADAEDGEVILVDEYTSVVDRDVAKSMSFALQKYIRKTNKKIILASCHYDIMEWLMPDWTCSPQKGGALERGEWLRQGRPQIELQVSRVESNTWNFFKKHHYLTEKANKSCQFLIFEWNSKPVAMCCILNTPRKGMGEAMAISRIVVLPDFQGMGIGYKICSFVGGIYKNRGNRIFIKTVNPALGIKFNNTTEWRGTTFNGKKAPHVNLDAKAKNRFDRISYCHEYDSEGISGYEELLRPIKEMRESKKLLLT